VTRPAPALEVRRLDPGALGEALDRDGYATIPGLIDAPGCAELAAIYDEDERFRKVVVMGRHGYGRGEYRYFARPLPDQVQALRDGLYPALAAIANRWDERLGSPGRWPATHADLAAKCAAAGQTKPTPLLLRYGPGDYNRLHQDIYGDLVFPLQVVVLLDQPGGDFAGGELVLSEGRARMQSRPIVVALGQGDAVVIPVRERPVQGARGWTRATMRHGVSEVRSGRRRTLGIIFHDAA
jgi:hypothetical protein